MNFKRIAESVAKDYISSSKKKVSYKIEDDLDDKKEEFNLKNIDIDKLGDIDESFIDEEFDELVKETTDRAISLSESFDRLIEILPNFPVSYKKIKTLKKNTDEVLDTLFTDFK